MRGRGFLCSVFLLHLCAGLATAQQVEQVRAVFVLKGPCFPVSESQVTEIVLLVNGLTGVPWGAPEQSGGFNSLCKKLANKQLEGCPTDTGDSSSGDSGSGRRLLQDAACKNDKWYLYLDTTNPPDASETIMQTLRAAIANGDFMTKLAATTVKAESADLKILLKADPNADIPSADTSSSSGDGSSGGSSQEDSSSDSSSSDNAENSDSSGGGSSSNIGIIIGAAVGGAVLAVALAGVVAYVIVRRKRRAKREVVSVDVMVNRWKRRERPAAPYTAKSVRAHATPSAMAPPPEPERDDLDLELDFVLDADTTRSSPAEVAPQGKKKGKFFGRSKSRGGEYPS